MTHQGLLRHGSTISEGLRPSLLSVYADVADSDMASYNTKRCVSAMEEEGVVVLATLKPMLKPMPKLMPQMVAREVVVAACYCNSMLLKTVILHILPQRSPKWPYRTQTEI